MNSSILTAIESLCDDIATNTNPEENKKRAEAVVSLAFAGILLPQNMTTNTRNETSECEAAPVADVSKVPQAGERFTRGGIEFVALGMEQGGVLAIVSELLKEEMPLDKSNKNDWRTSSLRKYLNGEYLEQFNRGDLYRKYRESVPRFNNWWWTLTPWTCNPSYAYDARIVNSSGGVSSSGARNDNGVAPACIFNPEIFK